MRVVGYILYKFSGLQSAASYIDTWFAKCEIFFSSIEFVLIQEAMFAIFNAIVVVNILFAE